MQRTFTPLRQVREVISSLPPQEFIIVVIGSRECKACSQQHVELLKMKSFDPALKFYHVDGNEWNATFPPYSVSRVPVVYKADSVDGMVVLSNGLMALEALQQALLGRTLTGPVR
jgi:hypothetical protein